MNIEQKFLDLLYWIRDLGLTPEHPRRTDRFLNPYTKRITTYDPKKRHQLRHLLWLPNEAGVRAHLPSVKVEPAAGLTTARVGRWVGAGAGESEALLSLLNLLRQELHPLGA